MIFFDVLITLSIIIITGLGSAAFLNIAFTGEGSGTVAKNSMAGGAILARRVFAITIIVSTFLFAVPILYLLGVYSEWFARVSLSWGLSIAVTWSAAVLPLLICRLAVAKILLSTLFYSSSASSSSNKTMRVVAFLSWTVAVGILTATWYVLVFATADSTNLWSLKGAAEATNNQNKNSDDDSSDSSKQQQQQQQQSTDKKGGTTTHGFDQIEQSPEKKQKEQDDSQLQQQNDEQQHQYYQLIMSQNKHTPFSCRFTGNDVHVLKRSGILPGGDVADGAVGSKSASMSTSLSKANQERMLGRLAASNSKKRQEEQEQEGKSNKRQEPEQQLEKSGNNEDDVMDGKVSSDGSSSSVSDPPQQQQPETKPPSQDQSQQNDAQKEQKQQQQENVQNDEPKKPNQEKEQKFIITNREILSDLQQNACSGFRDSFLARIALAGAVCVAALSGFAAISTPAENLFPYLKRNSERDAHNALNRLQRRLKNVVKRWGAVSQEGARLSWQLRELSVAAPPPPPPPPSHQQSNSSSLFPNTKNVAGESGGGWFSKAKSFLSHVVSGGNSSNTGEAAKQRQLIEKRLEEITFEMAGYRFLTSNLLQAIESTSMTLEVASMGKSLGGKVRAVFGICLSLFGAAKTINLVISVFWRKLSGEDAATAMLRNFVTMFSLQGVFDVADLASKISLVLNMFLVVGSVRGFLILMFRLTQSKKSPSSSAASSTSATTTSLTASSENSSSSSTLSLNEPATAAPSSPSASMKQRFHSWWFSALLFGGPQVDFCPGTLSLVAFSLFMGLHFLGAFVLLRLGFPAKSRGIIIDAVGTVPFVPCHSVHDVSFLVSVLVTAVILRSTRVRLDEEDDDADDDDVGEMMMMSQV